MATDLSGLNNFKNKLAKYSSINAKFTNQVADAVAQRGEQIAAEEYAGVSNLSITRQRLGSGMSRLIAEKKGLAYIEFGTGKVGQQSNYDRAHLPDKDVPITGYWEYYYPSEHKITKDGEKGWYFGKTFTTGQPAGMQMYKTSQRLRNEMANIVKNKIRGDGESV